MPDVYLQYEGSRPLRTPNCVRIYVRCHGQKLKRIDARQSRWEGDVKYLDDLPPGLHKHEPTFEENGIGFWAIET